MKTIPRKKFYKSLLTLLYTAKASHIGSSLSCLDILAETFLGQMDQKDKFILSKGHAAPALYVILNHLGRISDDNLRTFHRNKTQYPAHPPPFLDKVIPFASGSLGHGVSLSCGIAHGMKFVYPYAKKRIPRIFCLISDGECNEGQVWEAAQYASAKKLHNLIVLIDNNKLQAFGKTKDVLGNGASIARWRSFGFEAYYCDGHNPKKIRETFSKIEKSSENKPKVIIFHTVKGYGVSFMEKKIEWHYLTLSESLYKKALMSIDKKIK